MPKELLLAPSMIAELIDMIDNALVVINADQGIIFTNRRTSAMFGASNATLQGEPFATLFMPDDREIFVQNIIRVVRREGEIDSEAMFRRLDGTSFLGRLAGTRFQWNRSKKGVIFSIHDISEMKQLERSLQHCERTAYLGRLVDDISHQIRNPLTAIAGLARRLGDKHGGGREVAAILAEAARLEHLLDIVNRFSRLPRPIIAEIPLNELIAELDRTVGREVEGLGCTWRCSCSERLTGKSLLMDTRLFSEAVRDVAINGCEAYAGRNTAASREIRCKIELHDDDTYPVVCRIEDDGRGVAEHAREHIFSHFYSDKTGHLGMGLSFARRIIEEQGGRMLVESETEGGTTVSFLLIRERRRLMRVQPLE